jgi:hypothetical protein
MTLSTRPKRTESRFFALPLLAICLLFLIQHSAFGETAGKVLPVHLAGPKLAARENSAWVWGIENGRFALFNTKDQGRSWAQCSLPKGLSEFVENERVLLNEDDQNFMNELPMSLWFSDANAEWITWINHARDGIATGIVTARSKDQCRTWTSVSAIWPAGVASDDDPNGEGLSAQFIGETGWALISGEPGTGNCPQAFMKTFDGGNSWHWVPNSSRGSKVLPERCPRAIWRFHNSTESWLSHPNYDGDYSGILWKTSDGGNTWANLSSLIKVPEGIRSDTSFIRSMSLAAFSSTDPNVGTLGIIFSQATQEELNSGKGHRRLTIYRTGDRGKSWQLAKEQDTGAQAEGSLTFEDNLHGFFCVYRTVDPNTVELDLAYTNDAGSTWSRHKLPVAVDANTLQLANNKLWAIKNAKDIAERTSLAVSENGGKTWQERPIMVPREMVIGTQTKSKILN